jgi:transcriptional regulator with XRE-family HTH domain
MNAKEFFYSKHTEYENDIDYQFYYYQTLVVEKMLEVLDENNLSKLQLAEILGVSAPYISKILNGGNFTLYKMIEICSKLNLDFNLIIKKKYNPKNFYQTGAIYQKAEGKAKIISTTSSTIYELQNEKR